SLVVGAILLVTYIMYVGASAFGWGETIRVRLKGGAASAEGRGGGSGEEEEDVDEETRKHEEEDAAEAERNARAAERRRKLRKENPLAVTIGVVGLLFFTGIIGLMAYLIVGVTDQVITQTALTPLFVGLILFPIICNLGELIAAFRGAWANDMD